MPRELLPQPQRLRFVLRPKYIPHGENSSYTNWGCRCDPCTAARVEWCSAWKRTESGKRSSRKDHLKRTYGITPETFDQMRNAQAGVCKICGEALPENKPGRFTCIDHNHESGVIRGLLCIECNSGIGFFKEDASLLAKASDYVKPDGNI